MNLGALVAAMAEKAGVSKKDAEASLKAFTDVVAEELKKGEKIQLVGFGTFEVSERAARTGRNPQTGAEMTIAASKAPKFKAGKALKDASASFFDTPAFSAIAATKSALFMIKFLLWIFIIYIIRAIFPNYLQEYIYLFLWGLSRKMRYFLGFYVLLPFLKPYFELN